LLDFKGLLGLFLIMSQPSAEKDILGQPAQSQPKR